MFGTTAKDIEKIRGCLRDKATSNELAVRRSGSLDRDEVLYGIVSPYRLDINKLLECKALRRLQDKTQVIPGNTGNRHIRNRLIHTREVVANARLISEILGLNSDLAEAMAWGHDIGHTPFGHIGENKISELGQKTFHHFVFSVVIAQHIERAGLGLSLTKNTLKGILQHSRGKGKALTNDNMSLEAKVVMFSDKLAYTYGDISDIFYRGFVNLKKHPALEYKINRFGGTTPNRVLATIFELCRESAEANDVVFKHSEAAKLFEEIKAYLYENIYYQLNRDPLLNPILEATYDIIIKLGLDLDPAVVLALMTDEETKTLAEAGYRSGKNIFPNLGIFEIVQAINGKEIDFADPDLDW